MAFTKENRPQGKPWKKGQTGNPGGRPSKIKLGRALGQRLRDRLEDNDAFLFEAVVTKLIQKARKGDIKAINTCLEYGIGRPAQTVNLNTNDNAAKVKDIDARLKELGLAVIADEPGGEAGDAGTPGAPEKSDRVQ